MIILYDLCGRDPELRFSPYCWRAKMALAHKGLAFETVPPRSPRFRRSRTGRRRRCPSSTTTAGLSAIRSTSPSISTEPIRTALPCSAATARWRPDIFLQAWAFQALHSVIVRMVLKAIHGALADADADYFRRSREARFGCRLEDYQSGIEANAAALAAALEPARRALAHHPWLAGPAPAFADYIVFGSLMWLTTIAGRLPLEQGDGVAVWFRRCLELHGGIGAKAKRAA